MNDSFDDTKKKLSLFKKQDSKLKKQQEHDKLKGKKAQSDKENKERFYCTSKELRNELLNWRNSAPNGIKVKKMIDGQLVETELRPDIPEGHEPFQEGTKYYIEYPKTDKRYIEVTSKDKNIVFYYEDDDKVIEDVTADVENSGWTFDISDPFDRILSEELGRMMMKIGDKLLNHSNFRNYPQDLKADMRSFFFQKIIKGLKSFNFRFSNAFAFFSTVGFNAYLTVIGKHYKQQNIKFELITKLQEELQTYQGMSTQSGIGKYIQNYIDMNEEYHQPKSKKNKEEDNNDV